MLEIVMSYARKSPARERIAPESYVFYWGKQPRKSFFARGGRDSPLEQLISDKEIKGNPNFFLGKIWLELVLAWLDFEKFCPSLEAIQASTSAAITVAIGRLSSALLYLRRAKV